MALLDVDAPLFDPDLTDLFDVRRRMENIDIHGRSVVTETRIPRIVGVVTSIGPSDLERKDDYETMFRSISIVCQFRLRGETTNEQPDLVVWRGSNYIVKHVDLYPQFGRGFIQAECISVEKVDPAIEPSAPGGLAFNSAVNSGFAFLR